jgi:nitroreductase
VVNVDLIEAIKTRKTYRGFKSDPIPEKVLREIMELAIRAPSWANTQPWEFAVVSGKKLDEIKQGFLKKAEENEPAPDLAFPRVFPDPYRSRLPAMRRGPDADKIRDDKELRRQRQIQGARMYGCPSVIYLYTERAFYTQEGKGLNVYPVFDCGLAAENIMLAAVNYGLGTTPAAQAVPFPDVVRKVLGLPESKLIVLGIFIGYPDPGHQQYSVYSSRESFGDLVKFYS